jgi:hypothetical protein
MATPEQGYKNAMLKRQKSILGVPVNTPSPVTPTAPVAPVAPTGNPLGIDEFIKKNYGGMPSAEAGEAYVKYRDSLKSQQDKYNKDLDKYNLDTNYNAATSSLTPAAEADTAEYNRLSPLAQRRLIGNLNSRGLGASLAAGGSGSGAYSELLNSQAQGLGNLQAGYQDLSNQLERQKASDTIDMDSFYRSLAGQREYARQLQKQNAFGFEDILGLGLGAAKGFL